MSFSMVNVVSLYLFRKHNNSVSIFHAHFVPYLFFFLSSFNPTVFIKFFLIQKSKSSTNLNLKEGKQEEVTIN